MEIFYMEDCMEIRFKFEGTTLIVQFDGEIDHHTAAEIREKIDWEIGRNPIRNVIFDFHNVSFMDSSGVAVVIGRFKNLQKIGGKVGIINLNPQIERVFEISGLFKIISRYNDLQQAVSNM
jgi:stage II sporulation protein AA (anti-sigma F factor antagonist)